MKRLAVGILAFAALVLAGCGGATTTVTVDSSASATGQAPAPAPAPTRAEDRRTARKAAVTIEDMPNDWSTIDGEPPNEPAGKSSCRALERAKKTLTGRGTSGGFSDGEQSEINQYVYVYADDAAATKAFEDLVAESALRCDARESKEYMEEAARDHVVVEGVSSSIVKVPRAGDQVHGSRARVHYTSYENDASVDFDTVRTRIGRAVSTLVFYEVSAPDRATVQRAAVKRLQATLDG